MREKQSETDKNRRTERQRTRLGKNRTRLLALQPGLEELHSDTRNRARRWDRSRRKLEELYKETTENKEGTHQNLDCKFTTQRLELEDLGDEYDKEEGALAESLQCMNDAIYRWSTTTLATIEELRHQSKKFCGRSHQNRPRAERVHQ